MQCPSCKQPITGLSEGSRFCPYCGYRFSDEETSLLTENVAANVSYTPSGNEGETVLDDVICDQYEFNGEQNPYVQQTQYLQQNQYGQYPQQNPYEQYGQYNQNGRQNAYDPYGSRQNQYGQYSPQGDQTTLAREAASKAAQQRIEEEERSQEKKDLTKKILIIAAAAILLIAAILILFLVVLKPGSDSSSVESDLSSVNASEFGITEEEAKAIVEDYYQCYAVKTGESGDSVFFDCYQTHNKQTDEYEDKLGTVQINLKTSMMQSVDSEGELDTEPVDITEVAPAAALPPTSASAADTDDNTTVTGTKYVCNLDYGHYLYKEANYNDYYCLIEVGEAVGYIEDISGTDFAKVSYGNYIGYFMKKYLSDSKPTVDTAVKYNMYISQDGVKFLEGPSNKCDAIRTLTKNTEVGYIRDMVQDAFKDYAKVQYQGTIGYVAKKYLSTEKITTPTPTPTPKENTTVVSYKYVANVDYAVYLYSDIAAQSPVGTVLLGEKVGFIEYSSDGSMAKVNYNGQLGYIRKIYLSDSQPYIDTTVKRNMVINTDNTAFKYSPTAGGSVISYLSAGTTVGYIMDMEYAADFAKINYNGQIGYVLKAALSEETYNAPEPEPETPAVTYGNISFSCSASSEAGPGDDADNITDNDPSTAWSEGADGDGSGEWLVLSVDVGAEITEIMVSPGYCSDEQSFLDYGCPTTLEICSGGTSVTIDLSAYADSYEECKSGINIELDSSIISDGTVYIYIRGVRAGGSYSDTSISDIVLFGYQ